jgi:hypothetical protein
LGEEWKPSTSRLILSREGGENRLNIHVDPSRPEAWRREPYYAMIKRWARAGMIDRGQVIVMIGQRIIVVLPEHEVDFGIMADDELIVISEKPGGANPTYEAYAVKRGTEVGSDIAAAEGKAMALPADADRGAFRAGRRVR